MASQISNVNFELKDHLGRSYFINHCYGCHDGCPPGSNHYVGRIEAFEILCDIFVKHRIIRKCNHYKFGKCEYGSNCLNLHIKHGVNLGRTMMRIVENIIDNKLNTKLVSEDATKNSYYNYYDCHTTSGLINLITYTNLIISKQTFKQLYVKDLQSLLDKSRGSIDKGINIEPYFRKRKLEDVSDVGNVGDITNRSYYSDADKFLGKIKKEIDFGESFSSNSTMDNSVGSYSFHPKKDLRDTINASRHVSISPSPTVFSSRNFLPLDNGRSASLQKYKSCRYQDHNGLSEHSDKSLTCLEKERNSIVKKIRHLDTEINNMSYLAFETLMYYTPIDKIDIILKKKHALEKYNSTFADIKDEKIKEIVAKKILASL